MDLWRPSANPQLLYKRAQLLADLRGFFAARNAVEVEVPVLATSAVTDINIDSISAQVNGIKAYLQTSPEYFLKRLLASGFGDIYYLGKAFRDGEQGLRHNPEFTLLEWYRIGWDETQLMQEIEELITLVFQHIDRPQPTISYISYADAFESTLGVNPHSCSLQVLRQLAVDMGHQDWSNESRPNCLDLLFSQKVESQLSDGLVFVYDYPSCQAALSQIKSDRENNLVSRRFEVFLNHMELANGYFELTDAVQQQQRFEGDLLARAGAQKLPVALDKNLHSAMQAGLPNCSGVALGVDRLLMQMYDISSINEVLSFSWERC